MIFSVTERGVFRRCRRRAVLSSKNGQHLGLIFPPLNLSVGTIVHRASQLWLEHPERSMNDCAMEACMQAQEQVRENYKTCVGAYPDDNELAVTHEAIDFALTMCENYATKYGTPLPDNIKLISAEQKIRVPVPGTEHFLEGRLDGLGQHIATGRLVILERKTYGQRPKAEDLATNDQFLAYGWMVQQLGVEGEAYPEILYDGQWRRKAVPRGRTFDDLFARYVLTRTPAEYAEFERFLPIELGHMAELYAHPETAYINRPWQGCWDCPFDNSIKLERQGLCPAMSRGDTKLVNSIVQTQFIERTDDAGEEIEEATVE